MSALFVGLMISGTFFLGLSDVLKKKYLKTGVDEQALLTITLFLTGVLLIPVLMVVGLPTIASGFYLAAFGTIILNIVSQNLFIRAIHISDVSLIAPLRLLTPPLVVITGYLFLGEQPSWSGIIGICISMLGLYLLLYPPQTGGQYNPLQVLSDRGVQYGLAGAFLFAISFPLDKIAIMNSSAIFATMFIFSILGILTFLLNRLLRPEFSKIIMYTLKNNFKENSLVGICSCIGIVLTTQPLCTKSA